MTKQKKIAAVSIFILTSLLSQSEATIYKTTDKNGEVTFSDIQSGSQKAEEVTVKPLNTINMAIPEEVVQEEEEKPETADIKYKNLVITEPANETTFRGVGAITVKAKATPVLQEKHKMKLLLDGNPVGKAQAGSLFVLENIHRGEHRITVQIVNASGKPLIEAISTIYVFRPVIQRNPGNEPRPIPNPQ